MRTKETPSMAIHEGLPPSGSEENKNAPITNEDAPKQDGIETPQEIPAHITLPGDGHLTAQEAFNIDPTEQREAREHIEASTSTSLLDRLKKSRLAKIIGGAGIVLTAVGVTAGVTANAMKDKDETPGPQPTYSAPVTPGPSEGTKTSPSTEPSPSTPEKPTTPNIVQTVGETDVTGLRSLTYEQFEKLGLDGMPLVLSTAKNVSDQLALTDVTAIDLKDGTNFADYSPIMNKVDTRMGKPLSVLDSDIKIVRQNRYMWAIASGMENGIMNDISAEHPAGGYDSKGARMMLTGVDLPGSPSYKRDKDSLDPKNTDERTKINAGNLNSFELAAEPSGLFKYSHEGKQYDARKMRVKSDAGVYDYTYVFYPDDSLGEGKGLWLEAERDPVKIPKAAVK